ncbi:MAG TPA: hypothetical protein VNE21_08845, partial [Mycobacteriales bacterium]|nr:hypothetical protein [Mycobacteriales bacterium]
MNLVEERLSRCLHDCVPDPPGSVLFEDVARRARQRRRRSSAAILVALAVVIGATLPAVLLARGAARSGPAVPANARTLPLTRVATWGSIRFGYPAAWRAEDFHIVSYGPTSFGPYLSNQPMRNPCATRLAGTEISCGSPLSRLRPDGVLVTWLAGPSRAGLRGPPVPGTVVLTVDGHPASI